MENVPLDPDCADLAPADDALTPYGHEHAITYLRLPDAATDCADWRGVAEIVLHIDPARGPQRVRPAYESYMARARWLSESGYKLLLRHGWPGEN